MSMMFLSFIPLWEFHVGPSLGITSGDELWATRYILEIAVIVVSFYPKPIPIGMVLEVLRHKEHIAAYGEGNEHRLTGRHETIDINTFEWVDRNDNGNSWVSVPQTSQEEGTSVTKMSVPVTAEEKINKKNDVKARSLLLIALPNEHQLTFSQYSDAKTMFAAIKTRFRGNEATKKTHKALLKQQYENFNASSSESLDSIFNRLQKLVSRLAILGVIITQEDLNSKFLRSLPPKWNTHVVVWMNKADIETMSIDDFTSNTNEVNTANSACKVSTVSLNVNTASSSVSTANISDNDVYAFMVENPNGSNFLQHDLEQIHEDDLEVIDLKWQLSLLSMRVKRECRAPRNKDGQFRYQDNFRNQESSKRSVNVEDTSPKAMLAIDGVGYDWSDMAEEQIQTNMALMAFSDSELNNTEFKAATYKRGLATVEEQLVTFRKNEVLFSEEIAVLKREVGCKNYEICVLKTKFDKIKQEKEGIDFKIAKFDNASKCLDKLLESQITDKKPEFNRYGPRDTVLESTISCDKESDNSKENTDDSLEKEQVFDNENSFIESSPNVVKETIFHAAKKVEFVKPKNNEKPVKKSVRYAEMYTSQSPRGNQRNLNGQKSSKLGSEFVMYNKACFNCGSFGHMKRNCPHHQRKRMVTGNNYNRVDYDYYAKTSHTSTHRNMTPRAILLKSGLKPLSTIRPVYTAHSKPTVYSAKSMYFNQKVNIVRPKVVNTARSYTVTVNIGRENGVNVVKPSACWVWRPTRPNGASLGNPQLNDKGFVNSGCSRHMTGNIAYLSNFKEFDGGYVTFGGGAYGGRISGKGILKTDSLDFDDVYFVKELKFNIFSVSQMCDKKNYVLFTDTECLVLSPNFKLPDENQILLRIPREDNMYSFNMKNIGSNIEPLVSPRFTWVFFLTTKDETSKILKNFIKEIENLVDKKVKIIRCDYGTEFKNQNGVAERRNRTLIEAARTMLADSKLPTTFWAEAVSTACYVHNRVLIVKPYNKTPYELFRGFKPALSFMRLFRCHVTVLNTLDNLGKFDGKSDEGFFVGYSLSSKAFRVYNIRTKKVEENLHVGFLENKPMLDGNGPKWLFDIDSLTQTMNYVPVTAGTFSNESAGIQGDLNADASSPKPINTDEQEVNTARPKVNIAVSPVNTASPKDMLGASPLFEATHFEIFSDEDGPEVKLGNIPNSYAVPITPNTRIHKDHPHENMIGDLQSSIQTKGMKESTSKLGFLNTIYEEKTHEDLYTCLFACFLSQEEPKRVAKALCDPSWIEAMQEELLQFKLQKVWVLEEGIDYDDVFIPVARIEAIRLFLAYASFMGFIVYQMDVKSSFLYGTIAEEVYVCQPLGFEDPDYPDKVYKVVKVLYGLHQAPRAWYETLAKYLLDNGFHRGRIDPTLFIKKQKGDILLVQVYVDDILFGSTKKELCTNFEKLMKDKFQISFMGELTFFLGLQVKQKIDGIFISQDKYVAKILRKFKYTDMKTASTPFDLEKPLVKDGDADDVDVHLYRSMIRFQVTPKISHLIAVKRIFRYLNGKPTLGLWYSRNSPFELVAYTDIDYAGATQDRKSTTFGYQFLGNRFSGYKTNCWTIDLLTKGFDAGRFQYLVSSIGMLNP
ncbi:putative ribonuclease H-like domain-containing protein [Tanacetum coccineum]